jgi:hypothetical protein
LPLCVSSCVLVAFDLLLELVSSLWYHSTFGEFFCFSTFCWFIYSVLYLVEDMLGFHIEMSQFLWCHNIL